MRSSHYAFIYEQEMDHWWYRVRRLIMRDILRRIGLPTRAKILDIGCGAGGMLLSLEDRYDVYGIDPSMQAVRYCQERGLKHISIGNMTAIPDEDDSFDVVMATDVLEHVGDDMKALKEMNRALRPGGYGVLFVPAFTFLWGVTDEVSHHFRRYILSELKKKISKSGFTLVRGSYFNTFLFLPIALIRLSVRVLHLPVKSEDGSAGRLVNAILYRIFYLESILLRRIDLPFGVSALVVFRKPE